MTPRTIHAALVDGSGDPIPAGAGWTLTVTAVQRIGTLAPDAIPGFPDSAMWAPSQECLPLGGETTFELLPAAYDLLLRGPGFATTLLKVRVPDEDEHPDPLHLWQLLRDYSTA